MYSCNVIQKKCNAGAVNFDVPADPVDLPIWTEILEYRIVVLKVMTIDRTERRR